MQTGWTSLFTLAFALVSVGSSVGCAAPQAQAPLVAPTVAETNTTSAIVLGAPVTLANGPRTTIPNDPPR